MTIASPKAFPVITCKDIYKDGWTDLTKNGSMDPYEDPSQPVEKRVDDLVNPMTKAITIPVDAAESLWMLDKKMKKIFEPGAFEIQIGVSSKAIKLKDTLTVSP